MAAGESAPAARRQPRSSARSGSRPDPQARRRAAAENSRAPSCRRFRASIRARPGCRPRRSRRTSPPTRNPSAREFSSSPSRRVSRKSGIAGFRYSISTQLGQARVAMSRTDQNGKPFSRQWRESRNATSSSTGSSRFHHLHCRRLAAPHGTTQVTKSLGFIAKHGLWTDEQRRQAEDLKRRIATDNLTLVRLAWADPHGAARAKAVTPPVFLAALEGGYNINVATTTLDSANARIFASFTRGGGMGLDELTGSPNLTIIPDPSTFRLLPWAPGVGWVLCDEYFSSGIPFHFSPRQLLRRAVETLAGKGLSFIVGLEIEWYLLRVAEDRLGDENIGLPGLRGRPIKTVPVEPGFSYHSETNMDLMQPVLSALVEQFERVGLPLRSIENEWGPGQVECTFAARPALEAADHALLFRTATRQICRRMGHFATFMARPALKGYYSSGWHLHQSLLDRDGRNALMPEHAGECVSPL